ncbi:diacylglycerol kinase 7-like isoform X1 [Musa acuminata AAA Group]|uniref:diacylglycerol kinase 7-like isoform X1 n=1 Tax=Musa acuminata AAA Group TaxID=214697 RepID=UPI0031E06FAB
MSKSKVGMAPEDEAEATVKSSRWDSIQRCGIPRKIKIDEEKLRRDILIPEYLCKAMEDAIDKRDATVVGPSSGAEPSGGSEVPKAPLVVFVDFCSCEHRGQQMMRQLQQFISKGQVFDLLATKPSHFVQHGLTCLENLASQGDKCAEAIRQNLKIMVAGGDGTVSLVLKSLVELSVHNKKPIPPTGIFPLGTGNDLSRSFGWGGSIPFAWRSAFKQFLHKAVSNGVKHLDSWRVILMMHETKERNRSSLLNTLQNYDLTQSTLLQDEEIQVELPETKSFSEGVFYNYFSIGMDAQIAYGFHHLRQDKPYIAQGPTLNKLIYTGYSCKQGWFCTPCLKTPGLRGLDSILSLYIKRANKKTWKEIIVPPSVRAIVLLNLDNYAGGGHPWGYPTPEYLEKKSFYEAHPDDGLLEIFGLKHAWHASCVMAELSPAVHIAQAAAVKLRLKGGDSKEAYMQMDGEPWKQPIKKEYPNLVIIESTPFQSRIISGK